VPGKSEGIVALKVAPCRVPAIGSPSVQIGRDRSTACPLPLPRWANAGAHLEGGTAGAASRPRAGFPHGPSVVPPTHRPMFFVSLRGSGDQQICPLGTSGKAGNKPIVHHHIALHLADPPPAAPGRQGQSESPCSGSCASAGPCRRLFLASFVDRLRP